MFQTILCRVCKNIEIDRSPAGSPKIQTPPIRHHLVPAEGPGSNDKNIVFSVEVGCIRCWHVVVLVLSSSVIMKRSLLLYFVCKIVSSVYSKDWVKSNIGFVSVADGACLYSISYSLYVLSSLQCVLTLDATTAIIFQT